MTVGEKIQFYRKRNGLSQEELGQKMFVSRQTISLWEMDKTLPTIDNLLRLKDIFSISVDEILNESEPQEKIKKPNEIYNVKLDRAEFQDIYKKSKLFLIKRAIAFGISAAFLFIILLSTGVTDAIAGFVLGCLFVCIVSIIKGCLTYKKVWKKGELKILQSTYLYEVFDEYFMLTIFRNGVVVRTQRIDYGDIEKIHSYEKHYIIQVSGQSFIIRKDDLIPDSIFTKLYSNIPSKIEYKKPKGALKAISILLFVLSICTILGALMVVAGLSTINPFMPDNMWVFYLFLPIPIASVAFGFYLKNKGYRYKKNLIAGFIMIAVLCIYGSFVFVF